MRTFKAVVVIPLLLSLIAVAQNGSPSSADVEKRVDAILVQMTLEEKIDMLGGVNNFYVCPVPWLGLPALKMSDGPIGVRHWEPSTTLAGGIAVAATWYPDL